MPTGVYKHLNCKLEENMESLVSIIVPVCNTVEYIEECIQSILSQSYKNIELILVNDGSTDGSGDICREYEHYPNVKYFEQENSGATAARKRGVDEASGEWIMFVDSDDLLHKDAVSFLLSLSDNVDIVVSNSNCQNDFVNKIDRLSHVDYLRYMYGKKVTSGPWAKLFRKSLFNEMTFSFPYHITRWEDLLMNLQIASDNINDVKLTHNKVYTRRYRLNSTSNTNILSFDELQKICQIEDRIIGSNIDNKDFVQARLDNRITLFLHEIDKNGFVSDSHHPFVKDIKRCMNEAGVWRPMDRWLLSVSSPWAVKSVWNLRRVGVRLAHPAMIWRDVRKVSKLLNAALPHCRT
jgi:glycosyltransferase involved in cell wall biosynthesis